MRKDGIRRIKKALSVSVIMAAAVCGIAMGTGRDVYGATDSQETLAAGETAVSDETGENGEPAVPEIPAPT